MINIKTTQKVYNGSSGFTLIEVLVVVALVALLTALVVAVLNIEGIRTKSSDAVKRSNLTQLVDGIELYYVANRKYPLCDPAFYASGCNETPSNAGLIFAYLSPYVKNWPGADFVYRSTSSGNDFIVSVPLSSGGYVVYTPAGGYATCSATAIIACDALTCTCSN